MVLHGSVFPLDHSDPMWAKIDSRKKQQGLGHQAPKAGLLQKQRCCFFRAVGNAGGDLVREGLLLRALLLGFSLGYSSTAAQGLSRYLLPFGQTLPQ